MAHTVYIIFKMFSKFFGNCSLFCTFKVFRNLYCGYAQRANYGKKSLNHYFRHGAHCVHHIYTVLKLFEIEVSFAHFSGFEICTPVNRTVLTMTNRV